jgi:hypothetical protein
MVHRSHFTLKCVVWVSIGLASRDTAHAITYRTVALSNTTAPDTSAGVNFDTLFGHFNMDRNGQTALNAYIFGPGIDFYNEQGIWSESGGALQLIARTGSVPPGTASDVRFVTLYTSRRNDMGEVAFHAQTITPGISSRRGIWSTDGGSLHLVAIDGAHAPGTAGGVNFGESFPNLGNVGFGEPVFNNAGQVAFRASLTGTGVTTANSRGIWTEDGSGVRLVIRDGMSAPSFGPGVEYSDAIEPIYLNDGGQLAFQAALRGIGINDSNNTAIWFDQSGSLQLVTRAGTQAPGTASGVLFSRFDLWGFNDLSQAAITAVLVGPGITSANDDGVWTGAAGDLQLRAREGARPPDSPPGVTYTRFSDIDLNNRGEVAFRGFLAGSGINSTNDSGLWSSGGGHPLHLVARSGEHAPGTGSGVSFHGTFDSIVINDAGFTAFRAFLAGPQVDSSNSLGIWAETPRGLVKVGRSGELFAVAPGDFRTISQIYFVDYNSAGHIAFQADFTDGSTGNFVAKVSLVPEPEWAAVTALAGILFAASARRRKTLSVR